MNGTLALVWAAVGLAAGAALAPTAPWLAAVPQRRPHRLLMAGSTAMTFLVIAWRYPPTPALLALSVFAAVGVQLAAVDLLAQRLPRTLIWPTCVAVSILLTAESVSGGAGIVDLFRTAAAAITLVAGYLVVAFASQGGLGAGDVRLAVLVGGILGWHGWPSLLAGCMLGFMGTASVAAARINSHRNRAALPHGPGMLAGAFVALLL